MDLARKFRYHRWNAGCFLPMLLGMAWLLIVFGGNLLLGWPSWPGAPRWASLFPVALVAFLGPIFLKHVLRTAFDEVLVDERSVRWNGAFGRQVTIPCDQIRLVEERFFLGPGTRLIAVYGRDSSFTFTSEIKDYSTLLERLQALARQIQSV